MLPGAHQSTTRDAVPPRVGAGHAELSRMDPWLGMVPVPPGWAHTETLWRQTRAPHSAAKEKQNICALLGLVSQHLNLFRVSKCGQRALKRRLKAWMKHRTPQKDNLNFCHFKLCMAGVLERPPRLMSRQFKQQLDKSVINTEQFAFCLPVAFPALQRPSTDGELLISHFGPHHR